jgi:hypothetical protein
LIDGRVRGGVAVVLCLAAAGVAAGCEVKRDDPPPSHLTGPIVAIEGEGSDVRSFELESDGETWEIQIAPEIDYGFDLAHLHEHEAMGDPVIVLLEERDDRLYALSIEDA